LLEENTDKVDWSWISANPSVFELDYNLMKEHCSIYKEELIQAALHPSRIKRYLDMGINMEELDDYI